MSDAFGQKASLCPILRGILRDYSGSQILKELLQNADDAGATRFYVCLDKRRGAFGNKSLLSADMGEFQGPSLFAFDDVEFKEIDYASIQRVGDGLKRGDPTKTGQFGLGFNSCYHLTDMPMFCSGPNLVLFDPHTTYLPAGSRGERPTGRVINMQDKGDTYGKVGEYFADVYKDQVAPFTGMFGCTGKGTWEYDERSGAPGGKGTLFRLPLRTKKVASASLIKRSTVAVEPAAVQKEVLEPFIEDAASCLLFLRNVEDIKVYIWEDRQPEMELAFSTCMEDMDRNKREERKAQLNLLKKLFDEAEAALKKDRKYEWSDIEADNKAEAYQRALALMMKQPDHLIPRPILAFRIASQWGHRYRNLIPPQLSTALLLESTGAGAGAGAGAKTPPSLVEQYVLSTGFGDHNDQAFVAQTLADGRSMTLVPYAAVAARIAVSVRQGTSERALPLASVPLDGKVFCCLPSPIHTRLPVHIDGRWELTRDRNYLSGMSSSQGDKKGESGGEKDGQGEDAVVRGEWNHLLAQGVAASAYARLLRAILSPTFALTSLSENTSTSITTADYYSLFPLQGAGWDTMWTGLVSQLYAMLTQNDHPRWKLYTDNFDDVTVPGGRGTPFLRKLCSSKQASTSLQGVERLLYDDNRWCCAEEGLFLKRGDEGKAGTAAEGAESGLMGSLAGMVSGLRLGARDSPDPPQHVVSAPTNPPPSKQQKTGLFSRMFGSSSSSSSRDRSESAPVVSRRSVQPPPRPPKPQRNSAGSDSLPPLQQERQRAASAGAPEEDVSVSFLGVLIACGACVTDAPLPLMQALETYARCPGSLNPANVRRLLRERRMEMSPLGHYDAALQGVVCLPVAVAPVLEYVLSDQPKAADVAGLRLLPLLAKTGGGSQGDGLGCGEDCVYLAEFSDKATQASDQPILDLHVGGNGTFHPSPGTAFLLPKRDADTDSGAGHSADAAAVVSKYALPVVPFELAVLLFSLREGLRLRVANMDTVVQELAVAFGGDADGKLRMAGKMTGVRFVYPTSSSGEGEGEGEGGGSGSLAPLRVSDGLVIESALMARRRCGVNDYPGSNSGKARGTPIQLQRNSRKDARKDDGTGASTTYINMAYLDALMCYFEQPSVCAPSDSKIWKDVEIWPLVPVRVGGRLELRSARSVNKFSLLFPLDTGGSSRPRLEQRSRGATLMQEEAEEAVAEVIEAFEAPVLDAAFAFRTMGTSHVPPGIAASAAKPSDQPRQMLGALPDSTYDKWAPSVFEPKDVLALLAHAERKMGRLQAGLVMGRLSPSQKLGLLVYFACNVSSSSFTKKSLAELAMLPIFPLQTKEAGSSGGGGGGDKGSGFTALLGREGELKLDSDDAVEQALRTAADSWYTLPEFEQAFAVDMDIERFLARPPDLCLSLYTRLQIESLPRQEFYSQWVLPPERWQKIAPATRLALLTDIRANWEFMRQKPVQGAGKGTFESFFSQLPLFWNTYDEHGVETERVRWLAVTDMVDPRVPLLALFLPHLQPPPELCVGAGGGSSVARSRITGLPLAAQPSSYAADYPSLGSVSSSFLPWLEGIGMNVEVSPQLLYQSASRISDEYLEWEAAVRSYDNTKAGTGMPSYVKEELEARLKSLKENARKVVVHLLDHTLEIEAAFFRAKAKGKQEGKGDEKLQQPTGGANKTGQFASFKEWLKAFGELYVATVWLEPPAQVRSLVDTTTLGGLTTFKGSLAPTYNVTSTYCCSWSCRRTVKLFSAASGVPSYVIQGLGADTVVPIEVATKQLQFITSLPVRALQEWDASSPSNRGNSFGASDDSYGTSSSYASASRSSLHYTQAREDLSSTLGYIYKELALLIDASSYEKGGPTASAAALAHAQEKLAGQRVFLVEQSRRLRPAAAGGTPLFIEGGRVFADLDIDESGGGGGGGGGGDIAPFAYGIDSVHITLRLGAREKRLLQCLGASNSPTLEQVQRWTCELYASREQAGTASTPLGAEELTVALRLAHMAGRLCKAEIPADGGSPRSLMERMYIPDSRGLLRRASHGLFLDDAPWLSGRIDKARVPTVHSGIGADLATLIGVRKLSLAIREAPVMSQDGRDRGVPPNQQPPALRAAVQTWGANLISGAFQGSLRRAIHAGSKKSKSDGHGAEQLTSELLSLRLGLFARATFVPMTSVQSRFLLHLDDKDVDVTLDAGGSLAILVPVTSPDSPAAIAKAQTRTYLDPLTEDGRRVPQICLLIESTSMGAADLKSGWRRRLLAAIAIQINKYLGFSLPERALVPELLAADDASEMRDILNSWQVPSGSVDLSLGSTTSLSYDPHKPGEGQLMRCQASEAVDQGGIATGMAVYFPDISASAPAGGQWLKGRVELALQGGRAAVVMVTPEGLTQQFQTSVLLRARPTKTADKVDLEHLPELSEEEKRGGRERGGVESEDAAEKEGAGAGAGAASADVRINFPGVDTSGGKQGAQASTHGPGGEWTCSACTFLNASADAKCSMCESPRPQPSPGTGRGGLKGGLVTEGARPNHKQEATPAAGKADGGAKPASSSPSAYASPPNPENAILYRPDNYDEWLAQEESILSDMEQADAVNSALPLEPEPAGIDSFMLEKPSQEALALARSTDETIAAQDKLLKTSDKEAIQTQTSTRVRPGYDLLRVGNFADDDGRTPDIAFFHYRLEMHLVPRRTELVRAACKVLTELCLTVFNYDARLITLFYESGAPSRFIKQKIMLNLAPIEEHTKRRLGRNPASEQGGGLSRAEVLGSSFIYTYLYGLLIHKLAHFFDIVHGSRHNFFMTEYRAMFMMEWIHFLERQGLDPTTVAREEHAEGHLYNVVN